MVMLGLTFASPLENARKASSSTLVGRKAQVNIGDIGSVGTVVDSSQTTIINHGTAGSAGDAHCFPFCSPSVPIENKPCNTVGGKKCVFPFRYKEKTFDRCTFYETENNDPWCATEVYDNGYVTELGYDYCAKSCDA